MHITVPSGPVYLVIPFHSHWFSQEGLNDTYVCAVESIFTKLPITVQSGPVILVILCHSHCSSLRGISDTCGWVCRYIYYIAHNRAIRPLHASYYMPLVLVL